MTFYFHEQSPVEIVGTRQIYTKRPEHRELRYRTLNPDVAYPANVNLKCNLIT